MSVTRLQNKNFAWVPLDEDPKKPVKVITKESEAINFAIKHAKKGSFITICSDVVPDALDQIMRYKEEDDHFELHKEDIPNKVIS